MSIQPPVGFESESYGFQVGGKRFSLRFLPVTYLDNYDDAQLDRLQAATVYEVSFCLEKDLPSDGGWSSDFGITGTGDAFRVLGGVAHGVLSWLDKKQPRPGYLYWLALEPNRARLYDRMIRYFRSHGVRRLMDDPFTGEPIPPGTFWLEWHPPVDDSATPAGPPDSNSIPALHPPETAKMPRPSPPRSAKKYPPSDPVYRRVATDSARQAVRAWLQPRRRGLYLFEADGVECALEFHRGESSLPYHDAPGGTWRWGRTEAGEPGEDSSGEDVLLDLALGRTLLPELPEEGCPLPRRPLPPLAEETLTRAEIRTRAAARAKKNLARLRLERLPTE